MVSLFYISKFYMSNVVPAVLGVVVTAGNNQIPRSGTEADSPALQKLLRNAVRSCIGGTSRNEKSAVDAKLSSPARSRKAQCWVEWEKIAESRRDGTVFP